ncbi:MAG: TatD family hydrolase [Treponema sp.]|jgi:TatD DNase family protein|nr:TatD family hydrolase [Treponema sp.]
MKLIDIGVNLTHPSFNRDREEVIEAAACAGVSPLIITGTGEKASSEALRFAAEYSEKKPGALYATAGVHPHEARFCGERTIETLRELALSYRALAIGECGLDYNRNFSPQDVQRKWFEKQIELAAELSLPLFLHERDASEDFTAILKNCGARVQAKVVHCFTGAGAELEKYLDLGCYIGLTGWICDERRGGHLESLVKKIPPGRIMIETDAPFILPRNLPEKVRARRNEPKYLPHIAGTIARCLGRDPEDFAAETSATTRRFFGIQL